MTVGKQPITYCTIVLRLCLCEALYLPALRATFFQKKAKAEAALPHIVDAFGASSSALTGTFLQRKARIAGSRKRSCVRRGIRVPLTV